jgi:molybdopterin-containing oxidoreductase family membrane subunit
MAINRSAEAMTIFSVIQAGLFPIIHSSMVSVLGTNSNQFGSLWVNFNSPLLGCICDLNVPLFTCVLNWFVA